MIKGEDFEHHFLPTQILTITKGNLSMLQQRWALLFSCFAAWYVCSNLKSKRNLQEIILPIAVTNQELLKASFIPLALVFSISFNIFPTANRIDKRIIHKYCCHHLRMLVWIPYIYIIYKKTVMMVFEAGIGIKIRKKFGASKVCFLAKETRVLN